MFCRGKPLYHSSLFHRHILSTSFRDNWMELVMESISKEPDRYSCAINIFWVDYRGRRSLLACLCAVVAPDKQSSGRTSRTIQAYVAVQENREMLQSSLRLNAALELLEPRVLYLR